MNYNKEKVDEHTLALLYLVMYEIREYGGRAWKGFDWETLNRLHEQGWIGDPIGKAKSITVTPEGIEKARELFRNYFQV